jgi:hypothetical protein
MNASSYFSSIEEGQSPLAEARYLQEILNYMVIMLVRELRSHEVFKSSYALKLLMSKHSCQITDDDLIIAVSEGYESVKATLRMIADNFQSRNLVGDYVLREEISENTAGGIEFYDTEGNRILYVDVTLNDVVCGIKQFVFSIGSDDRFDVERLLANKLISILSRERFRRVNDLYDFYVIASTFDFDFQKLKEYVNLYGGAKWDNIIFDDAPFVKTKLTWDRVIFAGLDGKQLDKPSFNDAILQFYVVAVPVKENANYVRWNHTTLTFRIEE